METKTRLYHGLPAVLFDNKWVVISPHTMEIVRILEDQIDNEEIAKQLRANRFFDLSDPNASSDVFHLTLITTSNCNLKCLYCFVNCGEIIKYMDSELAFAAVRKGYESSEGRKLSIAFFGGEPSLTPDLIKKVVAYARSLLPESRTTELQFSIISNGVMGTEFLDFLIENDFLITLSVDGPPVVQDLQRPLINGMGSSAFVQKTIEHLVKNGKDFGIRATVTDFSVGYMPEMVEWLQSLGGKEIHFESLSIAGRAALKTKGTRMERPTVSDFADNLKSAIKRGGEIGVGILNSSFMNLLTPPIKFCDGHTKNRIAVSYTGEITTCVEVQDDCHPVAKDFIVGKYDPVRKDFFMTKEERGRSCGIIRLPGVTHEECSVCFAKNICGGGCPARNFHVTGDSATVDPFRCELIKEMLVHVIGLFNKAANPQA